MKTDSTPGQTSSRSPGTDILAGALVGLLLAAPVLALFYLGFALLDLPFVPFDVLDWAARTLPGDVITVGINAMVALIGALQLSETSSAAKTIEHIVAIAGLALTAALGSAALFVVQRGKQPGYSLLPGALLGLLIGLPTALISDSVNFISPADPLTRAVWVVGLFVGWGMAVHWAWAQLAAGQTPQQAAASDATAIDRRAFLVRLGGATALITVVGAGLGSALNTRDDGAPLDARASGDAALPPGLPNADDPLQPAPGTRLEYTPLAAHYRIDISALPPRIDGAAYTLPITGLVDKPLTLTLDDIAAYEPVDQFVTLSCISNPVGGDLIGTTRWTGVPMQRILADAGLQEGARYLRIYGADGFDETVDIASIMADPRIMLTYAWDGQPLTQEHGFPLRIYIPNVYGMKQPKWITRIDVVAGYEDGYWVRRGWDEVARMQATSVIDTVAVHAAYDDGSGLRVPIGGIAHAGARGIAKVEVRVDNGEWAEARLRRPLSDTTWVIWRYDWPFAEGTHTVSVRCVEASGAPQIETSAPPRPSGATGLHRRSARIRAPET
ncbi:MAG: molybdopterin-dependent oxidoreductase [Aggregatilineales bacterium]